MDDRRVCESCKQELGNTAYYRHKNDETGNICPSKKSFIEYDRSSRTIIDEHVFDDFALGESVSGSLTADSHVREIPCTGKFNFETTSTVDESVNFVDVNIGMQHTEGSECEEGSNDSASDCCYSSSSNGNEIWDLDSDDDDGDDLVSNPDNTAYKVISGIVLFLNIFHLGYRLSERAIIALMKFLKFLFWHVASICHHQLLLEIAHGIPTSVYKLQRYFRTRNSKYVTYVMCPKCSTLYEVEQCIIRNGTQEESKICDYIKFPNHPHITRRSKCGTVLMKKVKVGSKFKLVPRKSFIYYSIVQSLKAMCARHGFLQACEHWRNRTLSQSPVNTLGDIYDGQVWKDFKTIHGRPYLSIPYNLCFGLNIDWFNPYKQTQYSVGAMYLTIFNLPRSERFKLENIILVGMIPGPCEPSNVNPFLYPLVKELNYLYEGITVKTPTSFLSLTSVRAILVAIICDLPATRKVCGFANYNAVRGCSKCLKEFPTEKFGMKPDFSGFEPENWVCRDLDAHKTKALAAKSAPTASERRSIEKSYGAKYTELLKLTYLDIIRHHVVDPMHCIFLGIAKHAFKTWKDQEIIPRNFEILQEKVDSIDPPPKVGRIPRKITSGFSTLTADEWKNWILVYSVYALHGVLPENHYKAWVIFVESCRLFTLPIINHSQIERAHNLLVNYCKMFESLYGPENCSPNMHMSCHIKDCMFDYGPISSFWCFAFERYNGTLERMKKSWNCPEKQMFTKFIELQNVYNLQKTIINEKEDFVSVVCRNMILFEQQKDNGLDSLNLSAVPDEITREQVRNYHCNVALIDAKQKPFQILLEPLKEKCFVDLEFSFLHQMYSYLYPNSRIYQMSRFYLRSKQLTINNEEFITTSSCSQRSCVIAAHWPSVFDIDCSGEAPVRIGVVTHFILHEIFICDSLESKTSQIKHTLARVKWYMDHPCRDFFHSSIIVSATAFDNDSPASFMPVSRIAARCAAAKTTYSFDYGKDSIIVAIPMFKHFP